MTHQTNSVEETQNFAQNLAKKYTQGGIIALIGPLGSGKTAFTQGFAQGLDIKNKLLSPTFVLMRQYKIPHNPKGLLYHIDLYRLENTQQITGLGLEEIFANPHNIILIEWADKLGSLLPKQAAKITFRTVNVTKREITVISRP
ncbi:MAG: tRNA (adenosine(37)-N6)-threonylcarbamoyltransferase complex ATPase subunit type 1 TsaE [Armatimonadetes bacterium]|nr:MAG: tRNA (adenosine(37)-N6)-threonylcarbamoyltransferase complex ATPase subunit type 1 TsaE [Armatimonadota bacterium]